ncbi:MAG: PAS domain S-box protein [Bacteroidia bacterium]
MENKKIKILAIDDIPDNLISVRAQIREAFPEALIFTALNGEKGIELAATEDPDVILLDVVMPGMDGYEVCKLLKADQKLSNIPVVFVTAIKGDKEGRIRALECGAEALLAKPIDQSELVAQIRAMVRIKAANIIKQKEKEQLSQLVDEQVRELKLNHTATLNLLEDLRNEVEIRVQNEKKLEASEEHYRVLTQSASDAIVSINSDGLIDEWNGGAEKMFGYTKEDISGQPITVIMPQQYRHQHVHDIKQVAIDGDSQLTGKTLELVGLHQNGTEFPIELSLSSWETVAGKFYTGIIRDISERKNAEQKIREKDIQFQKLSANLPDLIFQLTRRPDGTFCVPVASEGIRNIFGCSPEDVIDDFTPIARVIYPEDAEKVMSEVEDSAKNLSPYSCEYRVQIPGQEIKWMHSRSTPELLADGSITWYGFNSDITERKQAEEALHRNESIHTKMLSNIGDVLVIIDKEGINRYKSENIEKWFGWKAEEVIGNSTWELVHPDDLDAAQQFVGNLMNEPGLVGTTECRYLCKDGSYKWIEITMMNLINDPDILGILGNYHDITERKLTELLIQGKTELIETQNIEYQLIIEENIQTNKQLTEARNKAEKNEARFKMAQKVSNSGSWEWDILNNTFYWSDEFLQLFGMPENTIPGFEAWTKALYPADVEIASRRIQEAIEMSTELLSDYRIILPDNEIRWIRSTGHAIYANGKPEKMVGMCMDITLTKEKEKELEEAKDHAEQSDRLKSAFLANMSHEIRTPMNGILGFAELLKEPGLTGKQQQHYISVIEKSGARMLNIINDIVDISKIEAGLMTVDIRESNINEQIDYIATFFKPEAEKKGIEFSCRTGLPDDKATIKTDREKVFAILTNLVKNAIKFTDKGSIEFGYVSTFRQAQGGAGSTSGAVSSVSSVGELVEPVEPVEPLLEFYVKDTGIGIPKDRQEAIFERFIQVENVDKMARQGAGLGLSISKAFVEMLGGRMRIESEVGKGSTVYFTLPYSAKTDKKEPNQIDTFMDEVLQQFKKLIILIAEDDEYSELFLEIVVKKISKKIIKAKTGFEAVEACRMNSDIDLVLMDVQMPLMDGYEATRQIRQINKDVVIIAQTAFGLSRDKEKAMLAGCNDYISKPIQREKLVNLLQKYFEN